MEGHTGSPDRRYWNAVRRIFFTGSVFLFGGALPALAQVNTSIEGIALSDRSPVEVVLYIISWALGILALIAVVIILYGGFVWMTSGGNEEKVEKAKQILKAAAIGLLIILSAWGIVLYVLGVLQDATGSPGSGTTSDGSCIGCSVPGGGSSFYVLSTNPEAGETDVLLCTDVTVYMSTDVDQTTVTAANWFITVEGGAPAGAACTSNSQCASGLCDAGTAACSGDTLAGTIGFGPGETSRYFNFIPDATLEQDTVYAATVVGGTSGVLSNDATPDDGIDDRVAMSSTYTWTFTTGSDTDTTPPTVEETASSPFPADGEVNVCTNTVVNFDFSEAMRVSTFNDDTSFTVDSAGTSTSPSAPDWIDPIALRGWSFGGDFDYAQARPASQLNDFSLYSARLYGGDAASEFSGALTDSCGNPLDGDADGSSEGSTVDNYFGAADLASEDPITWETGENSECTPVVEGIDPTSDYFGEYAGLREGEACTTNDECASGICTTGACEGFGDTSLAVSGLYLAPHPEVLMEGSTVYASGDLNTCFDTAHLGNVTTNTAVGDLCLDDELQSTAEILMRTPVGAADTTIRVSVAGETSQPSTDELDVLSPQISTIDPDDGAIGQYITISGQNFGSATGTVYMRSADGTRESVLSLPEACGDVWSPTEIVAIAPETYTNNDGTSGTWATGDIAYVQVQKASDSRYSDLQEFIFTDQIRPNLCTVSPDCQNSAPTGFTVTGENFGDSQGSSLVVFTSRSDSASGYYGAMSSWSDLEASGDTDSDMGNDDYWVSVYDGNTGLNSNGRSFEQPCSQAPQVVEINSCDQEAGIYPVPNPRPNETEACLNANLGVLFDQEMDTSSFEGNASVTQYNKGSEFDSDLADPLPVSGHFQVENWEVDIDDDTTYYGFQWNIDSVPETDDDNEPTGDTSLYLQPDTWYQVELTTGVTSADGVALEDTYTMQFHTQEEDALCEVASVEVSPQSSIQNEYWDTDLDDVARENFAGTPYDADCNMLDSDSYTWDWAIDDENIGNFGTGPGSGSSQNVYVSGNDEDNEGNATVTAAVEAIDDDAQFRVDLGYCESDDDCSSCAGSTCNETTSHCTPVINNFRPSSGDHGTWVTINGCMFGSSKGNVFWNTPRISAETEFPDAAICGDTWSSTQIIAEVPAQYDSDADGTRDTDLPEDDYTVQVETFYGDTDDSARDYTLNSTIRPGICRALPDDTGELEDTIISGKALGTVEGFASFLGDDDYTGDGTPDRISANADHTAWADDQIDTKVAIGAVTGLSVSGDDGFLAITDGGDEQCADDSFCSNSLDFTVACESSYDCASGCCSDSGICQEASACTSCETDEDCAAGGACTGSTCSDGQCTPVINALSPTSGPPEGPVTIQGCYFSSYSPTNGSAVTFNGTAATILCSDGWSNSQIIAEVPASITAGSTADVVVTNSNNDSSNTEVFSAVAQCSNGATIPAGGVPILCDLSPGSGRAESDDGSSAGTNITYTGDESRFVDPDAGADTQDNIFFDSLVGNNFTFNTADETEAEVPNGSGTGDATVEVNSCDSNGLAFAVECTNADDCPEGIACIDGLCAATACGCTPGTDDEEIAQCGSGSACYYDAGQADYCCAQRPEVVEVSIDDGATDICPNATFTVEFSEPMIGISAVLLQKKEADGSHTNVPRNVSWNGTFTEVVITPVTSMDTSTDYRLRMRSEEDGTAVIQLRSRSTDLYLNGGSHHTTFTTAASTCIPDSVVLKDEDGNETHTFTANGDQTTYEAEILSSDGQEIAETDDIGWDLSWSPYEAESCNQVAWINAEESETADNLTQPVISGNENDGSTSLDVTVTSNTPDTWTGSIGDSSAIYTFFCEEDQVWEYSDSANDDSFVSHSFPQHFRLIYCMEDGLPELDNVIVNTGSGPDDWFLQYLFNNSADEDIAFGVRAYSNSENLTPEEWYLEHVDAAGSPSVTTVDGYEAVQDGNSYYIAASNIVSDSDGDGTDDTTPAALYNNIYLFTFNDNDTMDDIKGQILDFVRFNTNVSHAECEASDKEKLVRDTKRVNDLGTIIAEANEYYGENGEYPEPQSEDFGSFIQEMTTSVWGSWQGALGNLFGTTLPEDPYNFYYAADSDDPYNAGDTPWVADDDTIQDCENIPDENIYYDESGTCWDPVNNNFFCPDYSHVYAWIREAADSASIFGRLEYSSGNTESYQEEHPVTSDVCADAGLSNAECACFNYGLSSDTASPGGDWISY
jgi:hypothetical protein